MCKKSKAFLSLLVVFAVFLLNACGESGEQETAEQATVQATASSNSPDDAEQEKMYNTLRAVLWRVSSFSVEKNNRFPSTKEEMEELYGKLDKSLDGYDVKYEVTERDGNVEEFVITVLNPAKTHQIIFESACYNEEGKCVERYQFRDPEKLLENSKVGPIE